MHFSGNATQGACPAGGLHENTGSGDYSLIILSGKAAAFSSVAAGAATMATAT
jgi:hypothetical protein